MIVGELDNQRRPYVRCRLFIPRLQIDSEIPFLLDTGAENTSLHLRDAVRTNIPFDLLENKVESVGIGGSSTYFLETVELAFYDADQMTFQCYRVGLLIAEPSEANAGLPSLLGRDVFNHWYMRFDPSNLRLDFTVRHADYTVEVV